MRNDIMEQKDQILFWIQNNESKAFICKKLNCKPLTLDMYLKKWNIIYNGNKGMKDKKIAPNRINVLDYIKKEYIKSSKLRNLLIRDGIKEAKCENPECGIVEWHGQPAPLELHHIDGNRFNNSLNNLEILCSNCHSLTENHSGKNCKI